MGIFDVATAAFGLIDPEEYGLSILPPVVWFGSGGLYILISALALWNQDTWLRQHQKMWRFYACALCWFWIRMFTYAIL